MDIGILNSIFVSDKAKYFIRREEEEEEDENAFERLIFAHPRKLR
jgi:hypothetical protein